MSDTITSSDWRDGLKVSKFTSYSKTTTTTTTTTTTATATTTTATTTYSKRLFTS